jgi:hypothetical protein
MGEDTGIFEIDKFKRVKYPMWVSRFPCGFNSLALFWMCNIQLFQTRQMFGNVGLAFRVWIQFYRLVLARHAICDCSWEVERLEPFLLAHIDGPHLEAVQRLLLCPTGPMWRSSKPSPTGWI